AFARRLEADDRRDTLRRSSPGVPAAPVVARLFAACALRLAHRVELFPGAIAVVGLALAHQLLGHFAVALEPLHLVVGPLVPGDAEPLHALEDRLARELGRPLEVRVLDAQDEGAVVAARIRPAEERS